MTNPVRIKIGLAAAIILSLAAIGYVISHPPFQDERRISETLREHFATWTGAKVSIRGPAKIRYFPRPTIETGELNLSGITQLPNVTAVKAEKTRFRLSLWSLISGAPRIDRVTLVSPVIEAVAQPQQSDTTKLPDSLQRFVEAVATSPVDEFLLENGAVNVTGTETTEKFSVPNAKIGVERDGAHTARGTFIWRKQPVAFSYEAAILETADNASRIPVVLSLSGELVRADIEGRLAANNGVRMDGQMALSVPNLPQFARWTGVLVPDSQKKGEFLAEGNFHWTGRRVGFDEGSFSLDGNKALGALALDFGRARPKIDGTLALQRLDLTQYFDHQSVEPAAGEDNNQKKAVELNFPVLHHINFDIRISTTDLVAQSLRLGQSALSLTLNAGKLVADVAIFELCGGSANGRLELDATVPDSAIRIGARMNGISARQCIELFTASSPLDGVGNLTADVTSSGRTAAEIFKHLRGKTTVSISAGQAAIGVDNLLAAVRNGPVTGWAAASGTTAFNLLEGDIFPRQNGFYTESFKIDLGNNSVIGEGTIDFAGQTLDLRLACSAKPASPDDANGTTQKVSPSPPPKVENIVVKGPWSHPTFAMGPRKSSAHMKPADGMQTAAGQLLDIK